MAFFDLKESVKRMNKMGNPAVLNFFELNADLFTGVFTTPSNYDERNIWFFDGWDLSPSATDLHWMNRLHRHVWVISIDCKPTAVVPVWMSVAHKDTWKGVAHISSHSGGELPVSLTLHSLKRSGLKSSTISAGVQPSEKPILGQTNPANGQGVGNHSSSGFC